MSNVGEYIKELRTKKGLTQEELGNIVGVKRAAVNKWESGMVQNLKRTTIQKLADLFDVNPSSFIDGKQTKSSESPARDPLERYNALSPKQQELFKLLLELNPDEVEQVKSYASYLKSQRRE